MPNQIVTVSMNLKLFLFIIKVYITIKIDFFYFLSLFPIENPLSVYIYTQLDYSIYFKRIILLYLFALYLSLSNKKSGRATLINGDFKLKFFKVFFDQTKDRFGILVSWTKENKNEN